VTALIIFLLGIWVGYQVGNNYTKILLRKLLDKRVNEIKEDLEEGEIER